MLTDFNDFLDEVKREDFQYVVPDFRLNKAFDKLEKLTDKEKIRWNSCVMSAVGSDVTTERTAMRL